MTNREAQMILSALVIEDRVEGDEVRAVMMACKALKLSEKLARYRKFRYRDKVMLQLWKEKETQ